MRNKSDKKLIFPKELFRKQTTTLFSEEFPRKREKQ